MRVGVYLRISMDRTGDELGVDRQRAECMRVCARHSWTDVVEYVDNDTSATRARGPKTAYARMIADARAGRIAAVVVLDLDRLVRRPREIEDWIDLAVEGGSVRLITADGEVDAATENGRMYLRIKAAVSMHEVERKGKRQRDENQQRAERGLPPGGRRAFGYDSTGAKKVRREAAAVMKAYDDLLAGGTLSAIADTLNKAGFTTTMGGPWKHNSVRIMLTNPRYAALRAHKGVLVGKATWPSMVGEEVWRAAVDILRDPDRRTNHRGSALTHLGTNLYLCGRCHDQTMICTYRGSKARGDQRRVYRCPKCYLTRAAEMIDYYVSRVVVARLRRPDLADLLATPKGDVNAAELRLEANALRVRLNALADNIQLSEAVLARRERAIRERLTELQGQLAEAGRGSAAQSLLGAADPGQAWLDLDSLSRRQAIVRDLLTVRLLPAGPGRRVFDPDTVDIT